MKRILFFLIILFLMIGVLYIYYINNYYVGNTIKLGSSLPLSGINKKLGLSVKKGALAYFNYTDEKKLLGNKKIKFIYYDDQYEPELMAENLNKLLHKNKVFALFGFVGTPTIERIMPIISTSNIPFIAPCSGASFLRNSHKNNFINFRSSYGDEIEKIIKYLVEEKKLTKIAIFYQNDDYGYDGYIGTIESLKKRGLHIVSEGTYRRNTLSVTQALKNIQASNPQAIIMVGAYRPVALFIKRYRKNNDLKTIFCNISFVNANELVKELNYNTKNMLFSQIVPSYNDKNIPVINEYRKIFKKFYPHTKFNFISLESFISAKITVTALKDIKGRINRDKFLQKLKDLKKIYDKKKIFGKVFLFKYKNNNFIEIK